VLKFEKTASKGNMFTEPHSVGKNSFLPASIPVTLFFLPAGAGRHAGNPPEYGAEIVAVGETAHGGDFGDVEPGMETQIGFGLFDAPPVEQLPEIVSGLSADDTAKIIRIHLKSVRQFGQRYVFRIAVSDKKIDLIEIILFVVTPSAVSALFFP